MGVQGRRESAEFAHGKKPEGSDDEQLNFLIGYPLNSATPLFPNRSASAADEAARGRREPRVHCGCMGAKPLRHGGCRLCQCAVPLGVLRQRA